MKPYFFVIDIVPLPDNKECQDIAGGRAHIWTISDDKEKAKLRAVDYIKKSHWQVIGFEYEFEIREEQIAMLHEDEASLHKKALQHGIAADYIAYPKIPGNPDDPPVIRQL